ncbi:MAG: polyribonucleotide nucleotidyltransferase, partial [Deltaproteobacteria bacterium]|nr:polyribonucleotide nucleotidyltransferase [Deltaproteobacteria bacterium]
MSIIRETISIGDRSITLETGRVAKQAGGSVLVQCGDTVVLVTACGAPHERPGIDFFPLTCDYLEKTFAAGKIPGGFFKREGRLRDEEVLVARLMDRPIRPLFPKGFKNETQVIATVLSADRINPPDVLAMTGASAALTLSDIPFEGPVVGIRVSRIEGRFVAYPTFQEMEQSELDLIVSVSKDAIVMVEGGAAQARESVIIDALMFAHESAQPLLRLQDQLREVGQRKRAVVPPPKDEALAARVRAVSLDETRAAETIPAKIERYARIREIEEKLLATMAGEYPDRAGEVRAAYDSMRKKLVRDRILDEGKRIDGRGPTDIRPITCEVGVLPRVHGSALFTRGETQAVVPTTLGTSKDEQKIDNLMG